MSRLVYSGASVINATTSLDIQVGGSSKLLVDGSNVTWAGILAGPSSGTVSCATQLTLEGNGGDSSVVIAGSLTLHGDDTVNITTGGSRVEIDAGGVEVAQFSEGLLSLFNGGNAGILIEASTIYRPEMASGNGLDLTIAAGGTLDPSTGGTLNLRGGYADNSDPEAVEHGYVYIYSGPEVLARFHHLDDSNDIVLYGDTTTVDGTIFTVWKNAGTEQFRVDSGSVVAKRDFSVEAGGAQCFKVNASGFVFGTGATVAKDTISDMTDTTGSAGTLDVIAGFPGVTYATDAPTIEGNSHQIFLKIKAILDTLQTHKLVNP